MSASIELFSGHRLHLCNFIQIVELNFTLLYFVYEINSLCVSQIIFCPILLQSCRFVTMNLTRCLMLFCYLQKCYSLVVGVRSRHLYYHYSEQTSWIPLVFGIIYAVISISRIMALYYGQILLLCINMHICMSCTYSIDHRTDKSLYLHCF